MSRLDIEPVSKVYERLEKRSEQWNNVEVEKVIDLDIRWKDASPTVAKSGYYAQVDGKSMPLTRGAISTACKLLKTTPEYFNQFEDKAEFPRALYKGIDDGKRKDKGLFLRHNGFEVSAMLNPGYVVRDAVTLFDDFVEMLEENVGEINGVVALEQGNGDICSYRFILEGNLLPGINAELGQNLMFIINTSENGIIPTQTTIGLFRHICTNSAIRRQQWIKWDHQPNFQNFFDGTANTLMSANYYKNQFKSIFQELLMAKLEVPGADLVEAFENAKLITKAHSDCALYYANAPTEDGRECETQYDLFNALTRGARDLASIQAREVAEANALKLFTEPGGIREQLRLAENSLKRKKKPLFN